METGSTTQQEHLELLELMIAGCKGLDLKSKKVTNFVLSNSYLIESLARSIVTTTGEGNVDQDEAMTVCSCAEMIKFLSGLNAYLSDRV